MKNRSENSEKIVRGPSRRRLKRKNNRQGKGHLFCDLTQSWSAQGGGVRTYLLQKRRHILEQTSDRHLLIIPGEQDSTVEEGRSITVTIASPRVPGSPNYRLLLRNRAVRSALDRFAPDLIECQDCYNLPWAAIAHARRNPGTILVACYMTDFPTVYLERPFRRTIGAWPARVLARLGYAYVKRLFAHFDMVSALSTSGGADKLRALGVDRVAIMPLGVEVEAFSPDKADPGLRSGQGIPDDAPLLIYAGRLDGEKKPDVVVDAFRRLPRALGAHLVLLGDGPLRPSIAALGDPRIHLPGFVSDRALLASWLATADLYVSGMADETFGVSIVEAQASGLPVVGVESGAMVDRVDDSVGRLGPVGDSIAMAANILGALDRRRMLGKAARRRALDFTWDNAMKILFEDIYPAARAVRAKRAEAVVPAEIAPVPLSRASFKTGSRRAREQAQ